MRNLLLILILTAAPLAAQAPAVVRGQVTDESGSPLPNARVSVRGGGASATTDGQGQFEVSVVAPGTHVLRVRLIGYRGDSALVELEPGEVETRTFVLRPTAVELSGVSVVGSRAAHTAAAELPVPVDVFGPELVESVGSSETAIILQELSPAVNFPRQSIADATDAVRPFTMRGLSPDHTLVLINGKRRHPTAVVHVFGTGIQEGSSGVDLNAIPPNAVERMEVLRDGAAAQYGSDAIAGVVNIELRKGAQPLAMGAEVGGYTPGRGYPNDGLVRSVTASAGVPLGAGSVMLFGMYRHRDPTNRAQPDPRPQLAPGDSTANPVPQPNHHWGDGKSVDRHFWLNAALPVSSGTEVYAFGGYTYRTTWNTGFYRRAMDRRNWPQIHPLGFLPGFDSPITDAAGAAGLRGLAAGWTYELSAQAGHDRFVFNIENSLNTSLGPSSPPNKTSFYAGALELNQYQASLDLRKELPVGLASPLNVALGTAFRLENFVEEAGEPASYIDGGHPDQYGDRAPAGSQVFPGFQPSNAVDAYRRNVGVYADLEARPAAPLLAAVAGRFERYSDFGNTLTGKVALRLQPVEQVVLRGAWSAGFRAPSLSQANYSAVATAFIADSTGTEVPTEVGLFRVDSDVARALGSQPLRPERSINLSAGLAFSPVERLTLTADYFRIRVRDRIILSGELSGDTIAALVRPYGASQARYFFNALRTLTEGVDVEAELRAPVRAGTVTLTGAFNWTSNVVDGPIENPPVLEGFQEQIFGHQARVRLERERPRTTTKLMARWQTARLAVGARATRYGEVIAAGDVPEWDQRLSPKAILDVDLEYRPSERLRLSAGSWNALNEFPDPARPEASYFGILAWPGASPFGFNGRYVYAKANVEL